MIIDNIPQEIIDECENLSKLEGKTYFIFDTHFSNEIEKIRDLNITKVIDRDNKISEILNENIKFHVGSIDNFKEMPSRFAHYDTEIKLTNRYKRYDYVINYLQSLGLNPNEFNIGKEYEQSYILEIPGKVKMVVRLRPNLFLTILTQTDKDDYLKVRYDGFFNKEKIMDIYQNTHPEMIQMVRDVKLKEILNYENK